MTNYREILRLEYLGLNNTQIIQSVGCSRTTAISSLPFWHLILQISEDWNLLLQTGNSNFI